MTQRNTAEAMEAVEDAQKQATKNGGAINEDALWEVNEMALDGASVKSMVQRLKQGRAEPYRPTGGWRAR